MTDNEYITRYEKIQIKVDALTEENKSLVENAKSMNETNQAILKKAMALEEENTKLKTTHQLLVDALEELAGLKSTFNNIKNLPGMIISVDYLLNEIEKIVEAALKAARGSDEARIYTAKMESN